MITTGKDSTLMIDSFLFVRFNFIDGKIFCVTEDILLHFFLIDLVLWISLDSRKGFVGMDRNFFVKIAAVPSTAW